MRPLVRILYERERVLLECVEYHLTYSFYSMTNSVCRHCWIYGVEFDARTAASIHALGVHLSGV